MTHMFNTKNPHLYLAKTAEYPEMKKIVEDYYRRTWVCFVYTLINPFCTGD